MYGYGGVGMILDIMTDNKNRISSDVRIAMNKKGGNLASPGAVAYNFDQKGVIQVPRKNVLEDALFLAVTEAGADEFEVEDEMYIITTPPELLFQVKEAIDKMGVKCESADLERIPKVYVECSPEDQKSQSRAHGIFRRARRRRCRLPQYEIRVILSGFRLKMPFPIGQSLKRRATSTMSLSSVS